MIATVTDQPSILRSVEEARANNYGSPANNIAADLRIALFGKDCVSLRKATDNPCAWKERFGYHLTQPTA